MFAVATVAFSSTASVATLASLAPTIVKSETLAALPTVTTTTMPPPTTTTTVAPEPPSPAMPSGRWYMVASVSSQLPKGFVDAIQSIDGADGVSVVSVGLAHLVTTFTSPEIYAEVVDQAPRGFVFPLEAMAFDVTTYAGFLPPDEAAVLEAMGPDEVILSATSARLRRLGVGGTMAFDDGSVVTVVAVMPDALVGGAEVITTRTENPLGASTPRYVLVHFNRDRGTLAARIAEAVPGELVRIRGPGDVPIYRHADVVLPQAQIKERFGEFAYRPRSGNQFTIEPAWKAENIVGVRLPLLGYTTCHKDMAALLTEAMNMLIDRGLSRVIDRRAFRGCFNSRFIADRRGISRHAWGVAADINFNRSSTRPGSAANPDLLAVMAAVGLTSGHAWLDSDPGHFEWYGATAPEEPAQLPR